MSINSSIHLIFYIPESVRRVLLQVRIRDLFQNEGQLFDLVSCQFSFHYCFESLPQAECMMKNAAESLRPGGYFIGTIPNANDIVFVNFFIIIQLVLDLLTSS